jgi:uncharacterized BrkB/YihY/UPF0761 family membrane protein
MKHNVLNGLTAVCGTLLPLIASACPMCNTETGQQVRAGIFDENFWTTLAVIVAPFPVLLLAIAIYHYGVPNFRFRWQAGSRPPLQPHAEKTATTPQP